MPLPDVLRFYSTPRLVRVSNPTLVVVYRGIQLLLLLYIAIYQIWLKKGYQKSSDFVGTVAIKVKGGGYVGDPLTCNDGPVAGNNW